MNGRKRLERVRFLLYAMDLQLYLLKSKVGGRSAQKIWVVIFAFTSVKRFKNTFCKHLLYLLGGETAGKSGDVPYTELQLTFLITGYMVEGCRWTVQNDNLRKTFIKKPAAYVKHFPRVFRTESYRSFHEKRNSFVLDPVGCAEVSSL